MRLDVWHMQHRERVTIAVQPDDTFVSAVIQIRLRFPSSAATTWRWFHCGKKLDESVIASDTTLRQLGIQEGNLLVALDSSVKYKKNEEKVFVPSLSPPLPDEEEEERKQEMPFPSAVQADSVARVSPQAQPDLESEPVFVPVREPGDSDAVLRLHHLGFTVASVRSALFVMENNEAAASEFLAENEEMVAVRADICANWVQRGNCPYGVGCRNLHAMSNALPIDIPVPAAAANIIVPSQGVASPEEVAALAAELEVIAASDSSLLSASAVAPTSATSAPAALPLAPSESPPSAPAAPAAPSASWRGVGWVQAVVSVLSGSAAVAVPLEAVAAPNVAAPLDAEMVVPSDAEVAAPVMVVPAPALAPVEQACHDLNDAAPQMEDGVAILCSMGFSIERASRAYFEYGTIDQALTFLAQDGAASDNEEEDDEDDN
jgi:hypothetical protein